ncbi:cytochrome ubiquinol oxidase subunit I, partial [Klebsiella pneumoniae]
AQQMIEFQPTKMASAEAACHDGTAFSVLTLGDLGAGDRTTCTDVTTVIELPGLLSYLAYEDFTTPVPGLNSLLPDFEERYGTH